MTTVIKQLVLYKTNTYIMDYNSSRKFLPLPEYGRHIQKMVDYARSIEDVERRTELAKSIIAVMGNMNPHLRDVHDFKHKLWDHLAIMSEYQMNIETPFPLPEPEVLAEKPTKMPYPVGRIRFRHYGKTVEKLIDSACEMEEGEEKFRLISLIASHMKKAYLMWNKDTVADETIFKELEVLSRGRLNISDELKLAETKDILARNKRTKRPANRPTNRPKQGYKPTKKY